jgi:RHS repeat-associated protein
MKKFLLVLIFAIAYVRAFSQCTPVAVIGQPLDISVIQGNSASFYVAVSGTAPYSYFWYKNNILVGTSGSYTTSALTTADNGSTVYCLITNCNSSQEARTRTATLTVTSCTPVSIVTQPQDLTAIQGTSATFNFSVTGTAPFSYFWYKNGVFLEQTSFPSYTTAPVTPADNGSSYYCLITNCASSQEVRTRTATLNVNSCTPVSMVSQPQDANSTIGNTATFNLSVAGTAPFSYFWYKNGGFLEQTQDPSYTTPILTSSDNGNTYYCLITNCASQQEVKTNTVTVNLNNCIPVSISSQPQNTTSSPGGTAMFNVGVSGTGLFSYFWYKDGVQIIGASSPTYQRLNLVSGDAGYYYCIVTNCNNGYQAISSPAKLTITGNNTPVVTQQYSINSNGQQLTAAEPIQLGTGSYEYQHVDFKIPVINDSLNFKRFYNSLNDTINGPIGFGWSHSYNYVLNIQKDQSTQLELLWIIRYPDGHISGFVPLNDGTGRSAILYVGTTDSLQKNSGGDFTMFTKDNHQYHFTAAGFLDQITDINGNTTSLNYTNNNLTSVVAPGGRTLSITYNGTLAASVVDPLNRTCSFSYDANGNLQSVTDANGGITAFTYDANHHMLTAANPLNNIIVSNTYDATGRVINQQDAYNQPTTIAYDTPSAGDATVTNPDNSQYTVHHDSAFRKTYIMDESGFTKTYAYDTYSNENGFIDENGETETRQFDKSGNLLVRNQPGGITTQITYNQFNSPLQLTDPNGNVTNFVYDGNDDLISIQFPDQTTRSYTYLPSGLKSTSKDGNGNQISYSYSAFGDLTTITAFNGTKSYSYDAAGRKIAYTNENNNTTQYRYDNNDNIVTITDALNHTTSFTYDLNNQLIKSVDKKGNTTSYTYDNKGRMASKTDANGGIAKYAYDVKDNLISVTDPDNNVVSYSYDAKGRRTGVTNALGTTKSQFDGVGNLTQVTDATSISTQYVYTDAYKIMTSIDGLNNTYNYSYDKNNNLLAVTDPLSKVTGYGYDAMNRLISVVDAASNTTKITYDNNGNKKTVTDANGHTQTYSYDAANRLISYLDAEGNTESYTIDGAGNTTAISKPTGTITKTYDAVNRVVAVANSTGNNYSFIYDNNNNIVTSSASLGASYFAYDKLNHLIQYTDPFNNKLLYSYDAAGNEQFITYPGNKTVSYTYDKANDLKTVSDWSNNTSNYTYDAAGRVTQLLYPNGIHCDYTFDAAGRLTGINNGSTGTTILVGSAYTLDAVGDRITEKKTGAVPSKLTANSRVYTYGNDDRLLNDSIWTYVNDNAGNRTSQTNGKMSETLNYSVDNLLSTFLNTSKVLTNYSYDAEGHRLSKSVGSENFRYVIDLNGNLSRVLQITDANGVIRSQYIYGKGLLERVDSTGNILYYHFDGQHNTAALSDPNGNITDTYACVPFGIVVSHAGNINQPFTFLGEFGVEQENSSFYYDRARYYDAETGRFLSKDSYPYSLQNPQSINRYVYATNNPLTRFDNDGLYQNQDNNQGTGSQNLVSETPNLWNGISYVNDQYNNFSNNFYVPFISEALSEASPLIDKAILQPISDINLAINLTTDISNYRNKKASLFETSVRVINDVLPTVASAVPYGGLVASLSEVVGTTLVNKTPIFNFLTNYFQKKYFSY